MWELKIVWQKELEQVPDLTWRPGPEDKLAVNKNVTLNYPGLNLQKVCESFDWIDDGAYVGSEFLQAWSQRLGSACLNFPYPVKAQAWLQLPDTTWSLKIPGLFQLLR